MDYLKKLKEYKFKKEIILEGKMDIYLNWKIIGTINNSITGNLYFSGSMRVYDEIRGYLISINTNWVFIGVSQYAALHRNNDIYKIALVLESPHKNEYDNFYNPLRPANGKTGIKINHKLQNRTALIKHLNQKSDYMVLIINPVQFQASCYNEFHGLVTSPQFSGNTVSRKNTNKVFRILFNQNKGNQCQDFINRLSMYQPAIIFNCCTYSLKGIVNSAISSYNSKLPFCTDIHPSVW